MRKEYYVFIPIWFKRKLLVTLDVTRSMAKFQWQIKYGS